MGGLDFTFVQTECLTFIHFLYSFRPILSHGGQGGGWICRHATRTESSVSPEILHGYFCKRDGLINRHDGTGRGSSINSLRLTSLFMLLLVSRNSQLWEEGGLTPKATAPLFLNRWLPAQTRSSSPSDVLPENSPRGVGGHHCNF